MSLYNRFNLLRCYCPVCNLYLGEKQSDETTVFNGDEDCKVSWIFYPDGKVPKAIFKTEHSYRCGCDRCGR